VSAIANNADPGTLNFSMCDLVVISKCNSALPADIATIAANAARVNPRATVVRCASLVAVDDAAAIEGKRVLCVDDGPTLTHGGCSSGAAGVAAKQYNAAAIVDPASTAVGAIAKTFQTFPHLLGNNGKAVTIPAVGYDESQLASCHADEFQLQSEH
jgi:predicted GTPase